MEKIAIMGAGSLGTILGAYIAQHRQIDLIDVNKEHVDALNKNGAKVIGKVEMVVPVNALVPDDLVGTYDLVFFMVKQLYNDMALKQLMPYLHQDSILCTLQNGYPEPTLINILGEEKVLGGTVGWGATWIEPGVSELTSDVDHMSFTLGRIDGKITPKVIETQKILELMCVTHVTETLRETRWAKLLTNASFSGMSAALGATFGEVLDNEISREYLHYLVNEIILVGDAIGIKTLPISKNDVRQLLEFNNEEERLAKAPIFEQIWRPHQLLRASMLQDLEKGLSTEIDAINGVVAEEGNKVGFPTPFCDLVIEIVKDIESGRKSPSMNNLDRMSKVLEEHRFKG